MPDTPGYRDEYFVAQGAINVRESFGWSDAQFEKGHKKPVEFFKNSI